MVGFKWTMFMFVFLFNLSVLFPFSIFFWVGRILFMTLSSFLLISCISVILVVALGLNSIYCLQGVLYHFETGSSLWALFLPNFVLLFSFLFFLLVLCQYPHYFCFKKPILFFLHILFFSQLFLLVGG